MRQNRRTIPSSSCSVSLRSPCRWIAVFAAARMGALPRSATSSRSPRGRPSMSRNNLRGAILALAAATALGGCTDMYLDRRDTVSFAAGDAVAANKVTHMIDPWPARAGDRNIAFDGERMAAAAERYRTDKVKAPSGINPSSVNYEPMLVQAAGK